MPNNNNNGGGGGGMAIALVLVVVCSVCCISLIGGVAVFRPTLCQLIPTYPILCAGSSATTAPPLPGATTAPPSASRSPWSRTFYKQYPKMTSHDPATLHTEVLTHSTDAGCRTACNGNAECGGYARARVKNAATGKYDCWLKGAKAIVRKENKFLPSEQWSLFVKG